MKKVSEMTSTEPKKEYRMKQIFWDSATPEDFITIELLDWVEGVGDITTHHERRFIQVFGESLKKHDVKIRQQVLDELASNHSTSPLIKFDQWQTVCIDKSCMNFSDDCQLKSECDTVKECEKHAE